MYAGSIGAIGGAVLAAQRVQPVALYALSTGANWTLMSGSFFALRHAGLSLHASSRATAGVGGSIPTDYKIYVSALSGSLSGAIFNGLVRGRTGIARAALLYGALGAAGQAGVDVLDDARRSYAAHNAEQAQQQHDGRPAEGPGVWATILGYTPLKQLSNDEFADLLRNRISELDAQIHLTTEEIDRTRQELRSQREAAATAGDMSADTVAATKP